MSGNRKKDTKGQFISFMKEKHRPYKNTRRARDRLMQERLDHAAIARRKEEQEDETILQRQLERWL